MRLVRLSSLNESYCMFGMMIILAMCLDMTFRFAAQHFRGFSHNVRAECARTECCECEHRGNGLLKSSMFFLM